MRWIFISPIVFLIYAGICFYLGKRILDFIRYFSPGIKPFLFWIPFALLCCGIILTNFLGRSMNFLRIASSVWMAVLMYLLMFFVLSELFRLGVFLMGKRIPNINLYIVGTALFLSVLLIVSGIFNARSIKTANYNITVRGTSNEHDSAKFPGNGSDIRIALVSDTHIGSLIGEAWIKRIVNTINQAQPDIVFLAGDIFDGNIDSIKNIPGVISELRKINAPLGVYAVLGNHDVDRISFEGGRTERILQILKDSNIIVLQDDVLEIREGIYLAGRKDARPIGMNVVRKTVEELLAGINGTIIMIDHQPEQFPQSEKAGVDLLLCGHTHSGQLFPSTLITRAIFNRAGSTSYGYWKGETMQAIVTSGAGIWGPPVRVGTNSEVAVINVSFMQ